MMKRVKMISLFVIIVLVSLFVCGCGKEEINNTDIIGPNTVKQTVVSEDFNETGTGVLKCKTEAEAADGIDVDLSYNIKYKNGNILELVSIQKITSSSTDSLDLYYDAYYNISKNYSGLDYYDTDIVRDSNTVIYTIFINYDKIDLDELLDIEGAEDNIVENGNAKLSLWLNLAGKMGTVCEEA